MWQGEWWAEGGCSAGGCFSSNFAVVVRHGIPVVLFVLVCMLIHRSEVFCPDRPPPRILGGDALAGRNIGLPLCSLLTTFAMVLLERRSIQVGP